MKIISSRAKMEEGVWDGGLGGPIVELGVQDKGKTVYVLGTVFDVFPGFAIASESILDDLTCGDDDKSEAASQKIIQRVDCEDEKMLSLIKGTMDSPYFAAMLLIDSLFHDCESYDEIIEKAPSLVGIKF